jgi:hypothetical protein
VSCPAHDGGQHFAATRRAFLGGVAAATMIPFAGLSAQTVPSPDPDAPAAPAVKISNGIVTATLYMPDPLKGYYRATRFDWSGVIADLQVGGHSYFGRWFATYNPKTHDAISGPVQEYVSGVGVLRKPAEPIKGFPTLEIVDGGKWSTRVRKDSVDFIHEVSDPASGYGYRYVKTLLLPAGKKQLLIKQRIESTGVNPLDTEMYDHNFFVIDGQPSGPDIEVRFPFQLQASDIRGDAVAVNGDRLNYKQVIEKPVRMQLKGFGPTPADYDIHVENKKTGAGVRVTADRPLSDLVFWTSPRASCPEAYIHVHADRGKPMVWQITYDFYSMPGAAA